MSHEQQEECSLLFKLAMRSSLSHILANFHVKVSMNVSFIELVRWPKRILDLQYGCLMLEKAGTCAVLFTGSRYGLICGMLYSYHMAKRMQGIVCLWNKRGTPTPTVHAPVHIYDVHAGTFGHSSHINDTRILSWVNTSCKAGKHHALTRGDRDALRCLGYSW